MESSDTVGRQDTVGCHEGTRVTAAAADRPRLVAGLRLVRLVGSGGEGEVWEARDELGRQRALKLIRPDALAGDAEDRSRHLLGIDHPALVRVYDGGRFGDGPLAGWGYLEMAFVDGPSLHDAPPDGAVLERLWPLAEALDLLHTGAWTDGLPLVHRDVKPANLVEDRDGRIVLVDPSTLRGIDATQLTRVGTPVFSAPEVMTGRFGPPADVYSFAATVVALLTGARGEQLASLLDEAHTLDLPAGVGYALSPVPGDRPGSCRAVLEAGTELADDTTVLLPALLDAQHAGAWPEPHTQGHWREDPDVEQPPSQRPPRLWPWVWSFLLLVAAPAAAAWGGILSGEQIMPLAAAVAGLHLVAQVAARQSLALAILLPPVGWAFLLGRRVSGSRRRRAWAIAVFTAAMLPGTAAVVAAAIDRFGFAGDTALAAVAATVALVLVTAASADAGGAGGIAARLLLTPMWAAGAAVVIVGGMLVAAFGRGRGLAWLTATSLLDGIRGPAMMPPSETPSWR
ncbi:MAG: hypothetical protein GEU74_02140 [Nitriliruptorales bacterium]|nr:hypothetical protein [Nitriliruptorales bacterium]